MSIASVVLRMCQVSGAERLDAGQIERLRTRRLRQLLAHVVTRSRFYREYYRRHGILLDRLPEVRLADLPPIDKQTVMDNFDALVCDPTITRAGVERFLEGSSDHRAMYKGRCHVTHTSGSTGSPGIFLYGRRDWDLMQAIVATRVLRYRPTLGRIRYAFLVNTDGHHAGVKLCQASSWIAFKQLALSINAPLDRTLDDVHRFQPHLLGGYGSGLASLAQQQLAGRIAIRPSRVISSGEPLTDNMTKTIREAFGTTPLDFYAASESLAIGASCKCHEGIHLFDDWHVAETIGPDGNPAQPGACGRLRLTNLYNYTLPLIRYEMKDEIVPAAGRCPCGSPFPLIKRIVGRTEEILWFEKGGGRRECIHPFALAGLHVPGVGQWQFIQTGPSELLILLKTANDPTTALRHANDQVMTILRSKQLESFVTVLVQVVHEIPNDPATGKYRLVIPYKPGRHIPLRWQTNGQHIPHSTG